MKSIPSIIGEYRRVSRYIGVINLFQVNLKVSSKNKKNKKVFILSYSLLNPHCKGIQCGFHLRNHGFSISIVGYLSLFAQTLPNLAAGNSQML